MKFGPLPLDEAEGALLAHSLREGGVSLKKGHRLNPEDLAAIAKLGRDSVIVAKLDESDVGEDEAAYRLADALAGKNVVTAEPFTGRANHYAQAAGVLTVDKDRLARINAVHESLTVATLECHSSVTERQMLSTVKIIPFAAPRWALEQAVEIARAGDPLLQLHAYRPHRVGLVATQLSDTKTAMLDKTRAVLDARLEPMASAIAREIRCAHTQDAVADAIASLMAEGLSPIFVFGASATVDRRDVVPAGIEAAGGEVRHFGMPVDPGNLLVLGQSDATSIIGLPGCARSPKLNGFDWVMARLLAGLDVTPADIQAMGHGGLLKEISSRPQPREGRDEHPSSPRIAAIVLAAGQSRRMGEINKLTAELDSKALVAHVVDAALAAATDRVLVVTGHQDREIREALGARQVVYVHNAAFAEGLSTSLKAGIAALPASMDGALIALGDMPDVTPGMLDKLIAAFDPEEGREIIVPVAQGKPGNPVLWGAAYFADMQTLTGDQGAKRLIAEHSDKVCEVEVGSDAIFRDLDTADALAARQAKGASTS